MSNLHSIIKKFSKVKVLVVGDVMLDQYLWGSVERISPEAPVPVVKLKKTSLVLGGAANVAANIAGLGAKPILVGAIGTDNEGKLFNPLLEELKISPRNLVKIRNRPTTIKTRVVAHNQHIVRIDQEENREFNKEDEKKIWSNLEKLVDEVDIVIVSDYSKGLLTKDLLLRLITKVHLRSKKIIIDPKGKDYNKYMGADIITPNRTEAADACGFQIDAKSVIENAGNKLLSELQLQAVLITQGENGMTLFSTTKKPFHLDALARNVFDVTGAGDTVIASLGVAVGSGCGLQEAAEIANISAGIVVSEIGTTSITLEKLKKYL